METLLFLFSRLPLRVVHGLGRFLGLMMYFLSSSYRSRIQENLTIAKMYSPQLAKSVAKEQAVQALEAPWVMKRQHHEILAHIHVDACEIQTLKQALSGSKATIFLTPHLGCYEVLPIWVSEQFLKGSDRQLAVLYRVPKKAYLRKFVSQGRASENIVPTSADLKGVRQLLKILKNGGLVGILPDQVPTDGSGVWAPFFNKQALTMTFPLRLAHQFDAQIIMAFAQRIDNGWSLHFQCLTLHGSDDEKVRATQMNQWIEALIKQCPEQYLWSYNRYKSPHGERPEEA